MMQNVSIPNIEKINRIETAKNARIFLKSGLDNWLSMAGMHRKDLLSPNNIELDKKIKNDLRCISIYNAQLLIKTVAIAIEKLPNERKKPYSKIIKDNYIYGINNIDCALDIGYSYSRYREHKQIALNLFALNFIHYQLIECISNPIKLVSYK